MQFYGHVIEIYENNILLINFMGPISCILNWIGSSLMPCQFSFEFLI